MDKIEAKKILDQEMDLLRTKRYSKLKEMIGSPVVFERKGQTGVLYQIEVEAFWDDPRKMDGDLRVIASIDDGRFLASLKPLSADFIIDQSGNFVEE